MKVLYLHQYFSFPFGSQPGRSFAFAGQLESVGYDVTICTGYSRGTDGGNDFAFRMGVRCISFGRMRVIQLNIPYSNSMEFSLRCGAFIAYAVATSILALARRWDIVVSSSTPLTVVIPLIFAKVVRGARCVFEVRDRWPEVPLALGVISKGSARVGEWMENLAVRLANTVIVLAPRTAAGYRRLGCDLRKLFFISNGAETFISVEGEVGVKRSLFRKEGIKVVYFGTLGPANGLEFFLRVARICQGAIRSVVLIMIGDGKKRSELVKKVSEEAISSVMFFDFIPRSRLKEVLGSSDVAAHCLENNSIFFDSASPNKIFEALSAGLPVISNCQSWIGRRLWEGGAGVVVPAADPFAFAHEVIKLGGDDEKRSQMGLAGLQLSLTDWSLRCLGVQFWRAVEVDSGDRFDQRLRRR